MNRILTLHDSTIFPDGTDSDTKDFSNRQAARAVVTNNHGQIALLKVSKHDYYKLPGGGVEAGEGVRQALARELVEEIGCTAEVLAEVGEIIEYRSKWQLKQTSVCYVAKQTGEPRPPAFTDKELADGFEVFWANDIDLAIELLTADKPTNYEGHFIRRRDLSFLKAAKPLLYS